MTDKSIDKWVGVGELAATLPAVLLLILSKIFDFNPTLPLSGCVSAMFLLGCYNIWAGTRKEKK